MLYLLIYTKNSPLYASCIIRESLSQKGYILMSTFLKTWAGSGTITLPWYTEKRRHRFCLISPPAATGTLYHPWRNYHFFHNVISETNLSSWSFQWLWLQCHYCWNGENEGRRGKNLFQHQSWSVKDQRLDLASSKIQCSSLSYFTSWFKAYWIQWSDL